MKNFKTGLALVSLIALLSLTGCQQKSHKETVKESIQKLTAVHAYEMDSQLKGTFSFSDPNPFATTPRTLTSNLNLDLKGGYDIKEVKDPKFTMKVDVSGNIDTEKLSALLDMRLLKDTFFFNIEKISLPQSSQVPSTVPLFLSGRWWKYPLSSQLVNDYVGIFKEETQDKSSEQNSMKKLVHTTDFFQDATLVGNESVKGQDSSHYSVTFNKDALGDFIIKASEMRGQEISDPEKQKFLDGFKKHIDIKGDIWVAKDSHIANQFDIQIRLSPEKEGDPSGSISFASTLWNFDKALAVQTPETSTDFPVEPFQKFLETGTLNPEDFKNEEMNHAGSSTSQQVSPTQQTGLTQEKQKSQAQTQHSSTSQIQQ